MVSALILGRKLLTSKVQKGHKKREGLKDERSCGKKSQVEEDEGVPSGSQHQDPRQVNEAIMIFQPPLIYPAILHKGETSYSQSLT